MDKVTRPRDIVKQVMCRYAELTPSHGNIRLDVVFDEKRDRYALMQSGWDRRRRVRGNLIYITLDQDKVFVEYDGIEGGVVKDLLAEGISEDRIVLSFLPGAPTVADTRLKTYSNRTESTGVPVSPGV